MKLIFTILLSIGISIIASSQGIQFETGTWSQVLAKAKEMKRPIFVDAYTTWCAPCKKMAKDVFTKEEIGEYFNATFINYQIDTEKGEGIDFAKQYEVNAYPTLLYFDTTGKLSFKAIGAKNEEDLLSQAKLALNPEYQIATYKREFEEGGRQIDDMHKYGRKLQEGGSYGAAAEVAGEFFRGMKEKEKTSNEGWKIISSYIFDYKNDIVEYVLKNKNKYYESVGKEKVNQYIFNILAIRSVPGTRGADSREVYYGTLKKYSKYVPVEYFVARMLYFENLTGNADSCYKYAKNLFEKKYKVIFQDDKLSYYRIFMANRYINESGEKLESAIKWSSEALKENPEDYKAAYILAQLLYKKGKCKEAKVLVAKAKTGIEQKTEAPVVRKLFKLDEIEGLIININKCVDNS